MFGLQIIVVHAGCPVLVRLFVARIHHKIVILSEVTKENEVEGPASPALPQARKMEKLSMTFLAGRTGSRRCTALTQTADLFIAMNLHHR
jgi:hypothetical protein